MDLILNVSQRTIEKATSLCVTLGVHSFSQLFDQLIEELEWNTYHAAPVKAALLQRSVGRAADSPTNGAQTSKEK